MQSLVKQVNLQTSSVICIMCHYIQLKTLTAESFYWIVYININKRAWHKFQCCHRYCCYMVYISYVTLMKFLCSKMHLHSNSFIFMEFIITTFTVYCAYQRFGITITCYKDEKLSMQTYKTLHDAWSCCYLVSTIHVNIWYLGVHIIFVNT